MASQPDNRDFKRTRDLYGNIWQRPEGGRLFDALYHNSLEIMFMTDFEGRFLDANDRCLTLFGFEREEIPSVYLADIIEEDDLPCAFEAIESIKKYGFDISTRELHLRNKRGRSIWLEVAGVRIDIRYKPSIILSLARDITSRKLQEEAIRQIEKRYKTLFDKSIELIFIYDLYGKIIDANSRALYLFGYEREELPDIKLADLMEKRDLPRAMKNTMLIFEHGVQPNTQEYRLKTKGGDEIWLEVSGVLMEQRGEPPTIIGLGRDISKRKNAEAKKKKKTGKSRSSKESSDFDALLETIVERSESALESAGENPRLKKELDNILIAARQALELAGDRPERQEGEETSS